LIQSADCPLRVAFGNRFALVLFNKAISARLSSLRCGSLLLGSRLAIHALALANPI
jgi:hypothetical protein